MKIEVDKLAFAVGSKRILNGVSVRFDGHRVYGVIGPNGSGKTTLLRHLYRQYPANGHIRVDGVPMERISRRQYARRVAVMMQLQSFAESELKVDEVVRTGRYPYKRVMLPYDREDEAILEKALRETLILTLHDLNLAARYCDTILLMRSGTILAEGAPSEILTHAWIEKGFGVEVSVIERNEEIYIGV